MKALVIGGAQCVFDDLAKAEQAFTPDLILAVNNIGMQLPNLQHWCTMHPEKMAKWLEIRVRNKHPQPRFWTSTVKDFKTKIPFEYIKSTGGGSGLLAVQVALHLGATKVVLAGIPMDSTMPHFDSSGNWREADHYKRGWERNKVVGPYLRSFSGWTKATYGEPSSGWLAA